MCSELSPSPLANVHPQERINAGQARSHLGRHRLRELSPSPLAHLRARDRIHARHALLYVRDHMQHELRPSPLALVRARATALMHGTTSFTSEHTFSTS